MSHKAKNVCGGFTDAQVQMESKGLNPEQILNWALSRPPYLRRFDKQSPSYPTQVGKVLALTSVSRLGTFLKDLTSFPDRSATTVLGAKASLWIATRAGSLAQAHARTDISVRTVATGRGYKQESVLVRLPGQDPSQPGVLIGGHLDTFSDNKPGADDDGTGVASVMEIYNAVLDSGLHFKRDLYFAFYAAEERGLYGSQALVSEFQKHHIPMRSILQFDMTGYKSSKDAKEIYLINDYVDANLTQFLKQLAVTYLKLPVQLIGDTRCGYAWSDHASWTDAGYSSAFPFESSFENYNPTIHTRNDTLSLVTPTHVMKFVNLGAAIAIETADPL